MVELQGWDRFSVAAGVGGTDEYRLCAISFLIRGEDVKDQDNGAKSGQNPDCHDRNNGKREYESTQ